MVLLSVCLCARHALLLGGESPTDLAVEELLAEGKGVHREVESEGSRIEG